MLYAIDKTHRDRSGGSRPPRKASRATSGTSSPPTPAPRPPPTGASSSPGSGRRVSTPTTSNGGLRWSVDLGRVDMGAYDIPAFEWGPGELAHHLERPGHRAVRHAGGFVPAGARCRHRRDGLEDAARRAAVVGNAHGGDDAGGPGARHQRVELRARLRSDGPGASCGSSAAARRSRRRRRSSRTACTSWPAAARQSARCSPCARAREAI